MGNIFKCNRCCRRNVLVGFYLVFRICNEITFWALDSLKKKHGS